jgi:hypothetical protein
MLLEQRGDAEMAEDRMAHRAHDVGQRVDAREHAQPGRPPAQRVQRAGKEEKRITSI